MSTKVQSSPSLSLLVLVNAVLFAVRDLLSPFLDVRGLSSLVLGGELAAVRDLLSPIALPVAPNNTAAVVAASAVLAALDAAAAAASRPPRRFYARVALMGHRDLGVSFVEEERLGDARALRITQLCEDPPVTHWTVTGALYDVRELPEPEALEEVARSHAERARERLEAERQAERLRALRAAHDVTVQRRGLSVEVRVSGEDGARRLTDGVARETLRAARFEGGGAWCDGRRVGLVEDYLSSDDATEAAREGSALVEALRSLGFRSVSVLPPLAEASTLHDRDGEDF